MRIPKINTGTLVNVQTRTGLVTGNWRSSRYTFPSITLNNAYYADSATVLDVALINVRDVISVTPVTGNKGIPTFCEADKIQAHGLGVAL